MKVDSKYIKLLSTIGPRASLGLFLIDVVKKNNKLMVVTSDVSTSAGLDRFRKIYSENYIDVGIAEQNLIGVATGLASTCVDFHCDKASGQRAYFIFSTTQRL